MPILTQAFDVEFDRFTDESQDRVGEVACTVGRGGALILKPLLLHASSKASSPNHRRVLHFLFGPASIGYGLRWQHAV